MLASASNMPSQVQQLRRQPRQEGRINPGRHHGAFEREPLPIDPGLQALQRQLDGRGHRELHGPGGRAHGAGSHGEPPVLVGASNEEVARAPLLRRGEPEERRARVIPPGTSASR